MMFTESHMFLLVKQARISWSLDDRMNTRWWEKKKLMALWVSKKFVLHFGNILMTGMSCKPCNRKGRWIWSKSSMEASCLGTFPTTPHVAEHYQTLLNFWVLLVPGCLLSHFLSSNFDLSYWLLELDPLLQEPLSLFLIFPLLLVSLNVRLFYWSLALVDTMVLIIIPTTMNSPTSTRSCRDCDLWESCQDHIESYLVPTRVSSQSLECSPIWAPWWTLRKNPWRAHPRHYWQLHNQSIHMSKAPCHSFQLLGNKEYILTLDLCNTICTKPRNDRLESCNNISGHVEHAQHD